MRARRRLVLASAAAALAAPLSSFAQQPPARVARVGVLGATTAAAYATRWAAMRTGLQELGYVEGRNLTIEYRWADGRLDRLPELAAELVRLKVDVLVTHGIPGTLAAKQATATIPIVMAIVTDPVAAGIVASLARPGGNVTGSAWFAPELSAKRLELLRELNPRIAQVAVLVNPANPMFVRAMLAAMETTAGRLRLRLQPFEARGPADFEGAFAAMSTARVDAVAVLEEAALNSHPAAIASLARKHRLPSVGNTEFAQAGGLVGYGANLLELFHRAAYLVDRLLKGASAGDTPIEQATKFELAINAATARALDATIPQSLLLRANRVVD